MDLLIHTAGALTLSCLYAHLLTSSVKGESNGKTQRTQSEDHHARAAPAHQPQIRSPIRKSSEPHRGERAYQDVGRYYIINYYNNSIASTGVDPEALGRELGVLKDYEEVVG